ncbi:hypothetical protein WM23_28285 [Burkholderia ubonensis]|nr:hypothetical protein WM23_28285 [Burkholderia ubonensis]
MAACTFWVDVRDDLAIARRAREAGFAIHLLTAWWQGTLGRRGLIMSFTNVCSQTEADRHFAELMRALKAWMNVNDA